MSLVVGVMTMDAIVVAGDTRAIDRIIGQSKSTQKVFVVGRNIVGAVGYGEYGVQPMTEAASLGAGCDTLGFARQLAACALADHMARDGSIPSRWRWARTKPTVELSRYGEEFVVAGYGADPLTGENRPLLYELRPANRYVPVRLMMEPYVALGRRDLAGHFLSVLYESGCSLRDALRLAVFVIYETARTDITVAAPIHVAVADKEGARRIGAKEIESLVAQCPRLSSRQVFGQLTAPEHEPD